MVPRAPSGAADAPMDPHIEITRAAARWQQRLRDTVLPYWLGLTDERFGGYRMPDDVLRSWARRAGRRVLRGPREPQPDDKQLVDQARLVWLLAHAHRAGYGNGEYLAGATSGYDFLLAHSLDPSHGGYHWTTDRAGQVLNPVKHLYGQAFVIYAFVEYARASGDRDALTHALILHQLVDAHLHDDVHGGWREHGDADWGTLADDDPRIEVPFPGRKSGNAVVHVIEALSELLDETGDAHVRRSLVEALDCAERVLYPADPAAATEPYLRDWTLDPESEHLVSYGHNVEFAWLMLRAQDVLGVERSRDQFHAYVDHALRNGFDHRRGGLAIFGHGDEPAHRRYKLAWIQNELVCALVDALVEQDDDRYTRALVQTLDFVDRHMIDRRDAVMLESVQENGRRRWPKKSGHWKAGYHEVRAWVKLARAFAPAPDAPD